MTKFETIPGETPIDDISGLKIRGITTRAQLNASEAENIRKATIKYLTETPSRKRAPFDLAWSLRLHKEMFGDVWTWAGSLRTTALNIGCNASDVAPQLQSLLDDLAAWAEFGSYPVSEQAVRLHHRAVQIHPFLNGNGRWSRMLASIWLKQQGQPLVVWPETLIGTASEIREEYLQAVKAADKGDYDGLLRLHARFPQQDA